MWRSISYVSTTNLSLSPDEIKELLITTRHTNNRNDISGILLYADGNFFQVMEGKKEVIDTIFQKIKKDYRHDNLIKIFDRETCTRSFSEYHSSFITVNESYNNIELRAFLAIEKQNNPTGFKNIIYMTNKFLKL